jgi:glycyl-tRNA synthetase beta chain
MVGEFPELQGIMGRYYALADGEPARGGRRHRAGPLPAALRRRRAARRSNIGRAVALADKLDALIGFFGIGQVPTGDKDPFGLRRAALGVLRILMEAAAAAGDLPLIGDRAAGFAPELLVAEWRPPAARLHVYENGCATCCATPAMITGCRQIAPCWRSRPARIDLSRRELAAVQAFAALPEAAALAAANKRIVNILKKVDGGRAEVCRPYALLGGRRARRCSSAMFQVGAAAVEGHFAARRLHRGAARARRPAKPVDRFFDDVMVMAEEPLMRANRLACWPAAPGDEPRRRHLEALGLSNGR